MQKVELINIIAAETGMHKVDIRRFLDSFFKIVIDTVAAHERVEIANFGKFST